MLIRGAALVAVAVALGACGGEEPSPGSIELRGDDGTVTVMVEIADTAAERRRGLSGRAGLAEDAGMLFVNEADVVTGYHMEDTLIPLSLAFIDAGGTIVTLIDMEPCAADPCPEYKPSGPYRFGLEVNQGAFGRWGVGVGAAVVLPE